MAGSGDADGNRPPGPSHADDLEVLALLGDEHRRAIYFALRRADGPLSRKEVAAHLGINGRLATFHLEKLLQAGLLTAHYKRPPGRGGPGAGRTAKYYEPSDREVAITIPPRRYRRLSDLLVQASTDVRDEETPLQAAERVAYGQGCLDGAGLRRSGRWPWRRRGRAIEVLTDFLRQEGYEPYEMDDAVIGLSNCPFHDVAHGAPEVVCAVNQAYVDGLLETLSEPRLRVVAACRQPGDCCLLIGHVEQ